MARAAVRDPAKWGSGPSDLDMLALEVEVAELRGETSDLEALAAQLQAAAGQVGHGLYQGLAERALGLAKGSRGDGAAGQEFAQAAQRLSAFGADWLLGRTLAAWARTARQAGDRSEAKAKFTDAIQAFERVGAGPAAAEIRRERDAFDQ